MAVIDKVDAFIKIAEAIEKGDNNRVNKMSQIIDKAIDKDLRENKYSAKIDLRRDEKKIFNR